MNEFLVPKRKAVELLVLIFLGLVFYFTLRSFDFVILFSLGFIWNWAASQEQQINLKNPRKYKFSTLKTVFNLQNLFLRPFAKLPGSIKFIARILPAGTFWFAVIYFNESQMPWWAVYFGSFALELLVLETKLLKPKEQIL